MYYYKLYGMKVESDLEFPQLPICKDDESVDVQILKAEFSEEVAEKAKEKYYDFGREYSRFSNQTCQFQVYQGKKLTYALTGEGWPQYLQTYILGYGVSMIALQRDMLPIHCSALADEKGAILIAGESGSGKSTITTAFLNQGYRLMADDMALVDGENVYPAFPYQKLCRNVALEEGYKLEELIYINEEKDKFLAPYRGEFSTAGERMKGFILLKVVNGEKVVDGQISCLNSFHVFASNLFVRHIIGKEKYEPHIGQKCLQMASKVPVYLIGRPSGLDTTQEVVKKATEWVAGLADKN